MALPAGTRLGPYEVISAIGTSRMGEVCRAIDCNLERPVAIKVLPEAFAQDADRLARFEREAKTLAALNHPNIAQISRGATVAAVRLIITKRCPSSDRRRSGCRESLARLARRGDLKFSAVGL
jgi:serine/threonine protein kinase